MFLFKNVQLEAKKGQNDLMVLPSNDCHIHADYHASEEAFRIAKRMVSHPLQQN